MKSSGGESYLFREITSSKCTRNSKIVKKNLTTRLCALHTPDKLAKQNDSETEAKLQDQCSFKASRVLNWPSICIRDLSVLKNLTGLLSLFKFVDAIERLVLDSHAYLLRKGRSSI